MASIGIPPQPGGWLLHKEEEVLSQLKTHSRTNHNYHKVMQAVLHWVHAAQQKGGFPAYVQMGDIMHRLMVIPVIAFVKGDAKSGNTLISQFRGKNCTFRVPRLCFTSVKHLDDPMHKCCWVRMVDQKALHDMVTDLLVSPPNETNKNRTLHLKGRKEYLAALESMLAHHCQNAFFDIQFGHNPFGIMLTTPSDLISMSLASSSESAFTPTFMVKPLT
jgi:hypothetical protein